VPKETKAGFDRLEKLAFGDRKESSTFGKKPAKKIVR
jgi:hypothetical protein